MIILFLFISYGKNHYFHHIQCFKTYFDIKKNIPLLITFCKYNSQYDSFKIFQFNFAKIRVSKNCSTL